MVLSKYEKLIVPANGSEQKVIITTNSGILEDQVYWLEFLYIDWKKGKKVPAIKVLNRHKDFSFNILLSQIKNIEII